MTIQKMTALLKNSSEKSLIQFSSAFFNPVFVSLSLVHSRIMTRSTKAEFGCLHSLYYQKFSTVLAVNVILMDFEAVALCLHATLCSSGVITQLT